MISFTARIIMMGVCVALLSDCVSKSELTCSGNQTPRPAWINKTAFELDLPGGFYYGKGVANTQKEALAEAYGDIAQRVAVNIFARSVVQQTSNATRVEAVTKAISDIDATGIEPLFEWRDFVTCKHYIMVRVSKETAANWKTAAQSYLVSRPGLGRVRRPDFEIHAIRYGEIGKPKLLLQWQKALTANFLSKGAIIESALRTALRKSKVQLTDDKSLAKNILRLKLLPSGQTIVVEASLLNKTGSVLTKAAREASGGDLTAMARSLAQDILNDWLSESDDSSRPLGR